jgi:hypothetical protein
MQTHYEIVKTGEIGLLFLGIGNFIFEIVAFKEGSFSILSLIGMIVVIIYQILPLEKISSYFKGSQDTFKSRLNANNDEGYE